VSILGGASLNTSTQKQGLEEGANLGVRRDDVTALERDDVTRQELPRREGFPLALALHPGHWDRKSLRFGREEALDSKGCR
jgi:hypothetical protein